MMGETKKQSRKHKEYSAFEIPCLDIIGKKMNDQSLTFWAALSAKRSISQLHLRMFPKAIASQAQHMNSR